jgi:uncharacterized Zn finger protein (UPF0148 family)
METGWDRAEVRCPGCGEILVLRAALAQIWCPWCEEPYEVREVPHRADPSRIILILARVRRAPQ